MTSPTSTSTTVPLPQFLADIECTTDPGEQRIGQYASLLSRLDGGRDGKRYRVAVALVKAKKGDVPTSEEYTRYVMKTTARATELLLVAGWALPISDEDLDAVRALLPIVGKSGSKRFRWSAAKLREHRATTGSVISLPELRDRMRTRDELRNAKALIYKQRRRARLVEERAPEAAVLAKRDADAVVALVRAHRDEYGEGPMWAEVKTAMGWPSRIHTELAMAYLFGAGLLTHEPGVRRSLDVP